MSEELKPCPFCGSANVYLFDEQEGCMGREYYVKCCGSDCGNQSPHTYDRALSVRRWNTRVADSLAVSLRGCTDVISEAAVEISNYDSPKNPVVMRLRTALTLLNGGKP